MYYEVEVSLFYVLVRRSHKNKDELNLVRCPGWFFSRTGGEVAACKSKSWELLNGRHTKNIENCLLKCKCCWN